MLGIVVKTKIPILLFKISLLREIEKASCTLHENGNVWIAASELSPECIHLFGTFKLAGAAMYGFRVWKHGVSVILTSDKYLCLHWGNRKHIFSS